MKLFTDSIRDYVRGDHSVEENILKVLTNILTNCKNVYDVQKRFGFVFSEKECENFFIYANYDKLVENIVSPVRMPKKMCADKCLNALCYAVKQYPNNNIVIKKIK